MTEQEKAQILVDGLAAQMRQAGYDPTDIAGAFLTAASAIAVESIGSLRWATALEKSAAALRAPDVSEELQ